MATAGKDAYLQIDNAAGSLQNLTGKFTSIDHSLDVDLEDSTTLGDGAHEFTPTLKNGSISLNGIWDTTVDAHFAGIHGLAATSTYEFGPAGSTSGFVKYTGECRVTNYTVNTPVAGIVTFTVSIQLDGTQTRTTFS